MIELVVVAVILIVIMLTFVFILFKNIIKNMNENAKKYFVNKLQDYDYILEEKHKTLEVLKTEIEQKEVHKNILEKKQEEYEEYNDLNYARNKYDEEINTPKSK